MPNHFFDQPILNSPYACPQRHWELNADGQPTQKIEEFRRKAKEKAATMRTYWEPSVNHLGAHGRWAFAEFCDVYQIQADFAAKVERQFGQMIAAATAPAA